MRAKKKDAFHYVLTALIGYCQDAGIPIGMFDVHSIAKRGDALLGFGNTLKEPIDRKTRELVLRNGHNLLLEIKTQEKDNLTQPEADTFTEWEGNVNRVTSFTDVIELVSIYDKDISDAMYNLFKLKLEDIEKELRKERKI